MRLFDLRANVTPVSTITSTGVSFARFPDYIVLA